MDMPGTPLKGGVQEEPEPHQLAPFNAKKPWFYA